jgi:hypothetical protein
MKHPDRPWIEEAGLREVAHNRGNMSKPVESSVNMSRLEFNIGCLHIDIAEHSIEVVIPPGVLPVRRDIISKFILWSLAPKTDMLLLIMYVTILRAICKPCC